MEIDFRRKKGFICDMDGVLYHGNRVLPGAVEFVQRLQREGKEYLFLTNNSGYTPRELAQKPARKAASIRCWCSPVSPHGRRPRPTPTSPP